MKKANNEIFIIPIAVLIVWLINFLTFCFDSLFDIENLHDVKIDGVLFTSTIWAISIYLSLKIFKPIPIFLRQPLLRIIIWAPIIYLDFTDTRTGNPETPSYILYLFNDGLLPAFSLLLQPLNYMPDFQDRLIYSNMILWIGFALVQALILFCAERLITIKNKNSG